MVSEDGAQVGGVVFIDHDDGGRGFRSSGILAGHDDCVADKGIGEENILDFGWIQFASGHIDPITVAPDDPESGAVANDAVLWMKDAIAQFVIGGRREDAKAHGRTCNGEVPGDGVELEIHTAQWSADVALASHAAVAGIIADSTALARTVERMDFPAEALEKLIGDPRWERGAGRNAKPDPGEVPAECRKRRKNGRNRRENRGARGREAFEDCPWQGVTGHHHRDAPADQRRHQIAESVRV